MKVAIYSESPADEAAIRILSDAILGAPGEPIKMATLRSRGWPSVRSLLPGVIRHLYYQTDADILVVVVDSDDSPPHEVSHSITLPEPKCRFCELTAIAAVEINRLTPAKGRLPIRAAIGLAVPSIEAWLRCGQDVHVTETAWKRALNTGGSFPFSKSDLKQDIYGTTRPTLALATQCMVERARDLATKLHILERHFPGGFAPLVRSLRSK